MKIKRKILLPIILFIIPCILTGCWDRIELEERLIVVGLAFDCSDSEDSIIITQQYVNPKGIGGGEKGGASQKSAYGNIIVQGSSISDILEKSKNMKGRRPNYEHLKLIIISEDVARTFNLYKLLNAILRHPETQRNTNVLISKEKARLFFEITPNTEDVPVFRMLMLSSNSKIKSGIPPTLKLGDMSKLMAGGKSYTVQCLVMRDGIESPRDTMVTDTTPGKGDIYEINGAAIIKGDTYTLAGWLDEKETDGLNWITGKTESGIVEIKDKDTGQIIIYEVHNAESKIITKVSMSDKMLEYDKLSSKNISFTLKSKIEGTVVEDWLMTSNAFEEGYIEKVELAAQKEVINIIEETLNKIQKELKVDIAGFGKKLNIKYPKVWEKVKDNWEEIFSDVQVNVKVETYVKDYGRQGSKK
jgi:spore germination protein